MKSDFTAGIYESDPSRLERLSILVVHIDLDVFRKINKIYDYKGELIVTWNKKPTDQEMEDVSDVWAYRCFEYISKHQYRGNLLRKIEK